MKLWALFLYTSLSLSLSEGRSFFSFEPNPVLFEQAFDFNTSLSLIHKWLRKGIFFIQAILSLSNRIGGLQPLPLLKKSKEDVQMAENFLDSVNISGVAPQLTLTDTDIGAKSLKIDVNNDIAQIREKAGGENSLLSFDLNTNHINAFGIPQWWAPFVIGKGIITSDPNWFFFVLSNPVQDRPFIVSGGCGVDVQPNVNVGKIIGFQPSCARLAGTGMVSFGNAINAFCTNLGPAAQFVNSHVINITPIGGLPNPPTIPDPLTTGGFAQNSIALRIAKQRGVTRNYGIYYGSHAEGSEDAGTFAIYAADDNCFFGGNVGIGTLPAIPSISEQKIRIIGSNSPDNAIFFGVSGNNMSAFLDCWAKDINGVDVRARFGASRSGAGSINVVTNHSIDFSTNNIQRMRISADGNLGLGAAPAFGGGAGVIGIQNATTAPTTNPSDGGVLYTVGGALKYRGSAGTITTIAPA